MKAFLAIVAVAVLAIGGWYLFAERGAVSTDATTSGEVAPSTEEEIGVDTEEPTEAPVENSEAEAEQSPTLESAAEEAETAIEGMRTDLEEAADAAEAEVGETLNSLGERAEEAVEGTSNTVRNALERALGGASTDDESDAGSASSGDTADSTVTQPLERNVEGEEMRPSLDEALTVDGFDGVAIRDAIEQSDLDPLRKRTLQSMIAAAEQEPEQIQIVIDQVREALGL